MKDYRRLILDALLEKYENSKHYAAPGESNKPVSLAFNRRSFRDYFIDSTADYRFTIHRVCQQLAEEGLIRIIWAPLAMGQEIKRVDLVLGQLDPAYRAADRQPRRKFEKTFAQVAEKWLEQWQSGDAMRELREWGTAGHAPWMIHFVETARDAALAGTRLPAGFDPKEADLLDEICRVLDAVAGLDGEIPRRVLSLQALGHSKRLEQIRPRLIRVLKEFCPACSRKQGVVRDAPGNLLAELGIVDNPDLVRVAGPIKLNVSGGVIDLSLFHPDAGLPWQTIREADISCLNAERVVTVENLTSYYMYLQTAKPHTVVLYLGGYPSRGRIELLEKLRDYSRALKFSHWGDIDLGGFLIFDHLRRSCRLPLEPLYMDCNTLERHLNRAQSLAGTYAAKLRPLLGDPDFEVFHPVIKMMLQHGKRLEQESVVPGDAG